MAPRSFTRAGEEYIVETVYPNGQCDIKGEGGDHIYRVDPEDLELIDPNPSGA